MPTVLAFRTAPGAVVIPANQSKQLGQVDVSKYSKIRIIADQRVGSDTGIGLRFTITEGNELVAQLDTYTMAPHLSITKVYDMPGTKLTIFADDLAGGTTNGAVDVLIYGWQ